MFFLSKYTYKWRYRWPWTYFEPSTRFFESFCRAVICCFYSCNVYVRADSKQCYHIKQAMSHCSTLLVIHCNIACRSYISSCSLPLLRDKASSLRISCRLSSSGRWTGGYLPLYNHLRSDLPYFSYSYLITSAGFTLAAL